jgi:cyclopropane fatty-acyl-phospholipid synthase-like methyltransferase
MTVEQTNSSLPCEADFGSFDRFVSTYVVDLLSTSDIAALFSEAHRLLIQEGRLCLVSLTHGTSTFSRLVTSTWARLNRFSPTLVGGCRPQEVHALLQASSFHLEYVQTVTACGIPSEIVIVERQPEAREVKGTGKGVSL